jgi:hypothetical protein
LQNIGIKYAEDQLVNTVTSHENNQPKMNPTIKTAAQFVEKLNQSNEKSDKKEEGMQHKNKVRRVLKEKMGKQSNSWPVY